MFSHLIFTLIMQGSDSSSVSYCKHQKITLAMYKMKFKRKTSASSQEGTTEAGCALILKRTDKDMRYIKLWFLRY